MPALQSPTSARPRVSDDSLLRRYSEGHVSAREQIATRYMPLADRLAAHYRSSSESRQDLEQVAYVGLLKAIDRFEPGQGPFVAYAIPTIRGELKRHFRDRGWAIKPPRPLQERYLHVKRVLDRLSTALGRSPTINEIAAEADLTAGQVLEALEAATGYTLDTSLDAPLLTDDGSPRTVGETVGAEDPGYSRAEWSTIVAPAFKRLPVREQEVLYLRLVNDLKQREIADRIGVSQMQVSRLLRKALTAMSNEAAE